VTVALDREQSASVATQVVLAPPKPKFHPTNVQRLVNRGAPFALMLLGFATIALRGVYVLTFEKDTWKDLWAEITFFFWRTGRSAISVGGGLACILIGSYLLFPTHPNELHHRFEAALGMYTTAIGLTLTAHAFYSAHAPFVSVGRLLEE